MSWCSCKPVYNGVFQVPPSAYFQKPYLLNKLDQCNFSNYIDHFSLSGELMPNVTFESQSNGEISVANNQTHYAQVRTKLGKTVSNCTLQEII